MIDGLRRLRIPYHSLNQMEQCWILLVSVNGEVFGLIRKYQNFTAKSTCAEFA